MNSQLARILKLERPLITFDYETTGVDTSTCRAVSLAMKVHKPDGGLQYYKTLINPEMSIPEGASNVHKITDETIRLGCARCWGPAEGHPSEKCDRFRPVPRFRDIAPTLMKGFVDADFCGYNVQFDLKVSVAEFARAGLTFDYSKAAIIDPMVIWRILEPRHLSDAVERFGGGEGATILNEKGETVPFRMNAHDAMTDVEGTEVALIGQLTKHPKSDRIPRTPREIHELCFPRDPNALDPDGKFVFIDDQLCFGFGKHKGRPVLSQLGYVEWMRGADFTIHVKQVCEQILAGDIPVRS